MSSAQFLQEKRARHVARWEKLNDQYDELAEDPRKGYVLDTGDGRASGFTRSLEDVQKAIYQEEREIESIDRRLNRAGIQVVRLARFC